MQRSIIWQLIRKDWYLFRWLIAGSLLVGAIAVALLPHSEATFTIGSILIITSVIVHGVGLVMLAILQESRDKTLVFALSLPISPRDYGLAKVLANVSAFLLIVVAVSVAGWSVIVTTAIPDGLLPYAAMVMLALCVYYAVLLSVVLVTGSLSWAIGAVLLGNVSINLFMYGTAHLPTVAAYQRGPVPVWSGDVGTVMAAEIALIVCVLSVGLMLHFRKTDFV